MDDPSTRKKALIEAGFTKQLKGQTRLDASAVATASGVSQASVYCWINVVAGRLVTTLIERAITERAANGL